MDIITKDPEFVPTNFVICNFYGEDTCFCWDNDKFVFFPYMIKNYTSSLPVVLAPGPIKTVRCFSSRVFFACLPRGVYKLSREGRFSVLSKSALSVGSIFFEILTLKNDGLYLENKQNKSSKLLFYLSTTLQQHEDLCTFPLDLENSEQEFRNVLLDTNDMIDNLCLIGNGKKLFTLANEEVRIIYSCDNKILYIVPIQNNKKANGLVLITNTDAIIIMYAKDNILRHKKIYLEVKIKTLCAGFSQLSSDNIWIIYSNGSKLYYMTLTLSTDTCSKVKTERGFTCMQYYKEDIFVGLSEHSKLYELSTNVVESVKNSELSEDGFIRLRSDMLKGTDVIIEQICDRAKELQSWNAKLLIEENKLHRINLYACNKKLQMCPLMTVHRIAKQLFLNINFQEDLPKNVYIACSLTFNNKTIFSIKEVTGPGTSVDLLISTDNLSSSLTLNMDLITIINEGQPWFLVKNFITDPIIKKKKKQQLKKNKTIFINAKINLIKNLMTSGNLDMKKLSEIKRSIRKEIGDI